MKFILTKELGRLAKWLRILGFDAAYFNANNLSSLVIQALKEDRVILTRNQRISHTRGIKTVFVQDEMIKAQVAQVLRTLKIKLEPEAMFTRCILCNEELVGIEKGKVKDKVPEYVFKSQGQFITCPKCKRVYWQGTHWGNVVKTLEEIWNS